MAEGTVPTGTVLQVEIAGPAEVVPADIDPLVVPVEVTPVAVLGMVLAVVMGGDGGVLAVKLLVAGTQDPQLLHL